MPAPARRFLDEAFPPAARRELAFAVLLLIGCYLWGYATGWVNPRKSMDSTMFWPFYTDTWFPGPVWSLRVLLPAGVFALSWPTLRRWLNGSDDDGLTTLYVLVLAIWAFDLSVGFVRHGVENGLVFTFRRPQEYWNDVRYVTPGFLARFPNVGPLSQHGATHPPGPTLFLAFIQWLGFTSMRDAELACTPLAALAALPVYGATRRLADETSARMAAMLYLFAGSVVAFSVLSMDVLTMLCAAVAIYGMARAAEGDWKGGVIMGLALFAGSLCNFIVLTLPLTFGAIWLSRPNWRDRRIVTAVAVGAGTFLVGYALIHFVFGYRPIDVFHSCLVELSHSDDAHRSRGRSLSRGPLAFLLALGLPFCGLALRSFVDAYKHARGSVEDRRVALLVAGAAAPWLFAVLTGHPRGETEHVFLLFVPATAIATAIAARRFQSRSPRWLSDVALPLLALQAILVDVFWETYW